MSAVVYSDQISVVVFDVDGVLTDGRLHVSADGERVKSFHAHDGVAVALLRAHGIRSAILSGKHSEALTWRVTQLRVDAVVTGCHDKRTGFESIKQQLRVDDMQTAYVGDDVNDLCVIERVGVSYAPADAHALVRSRVSHVTSRAGGEGVAREVADHILTCGGLSLEDAYRPLFQLWSRHDVTQ